MNRPWNFRNAGKAAARMRIEYAAWLLEQLPEPPLHCRRTPMLVDAYRTLTRIKFDAAREHQVALAAGIDTAAAQDSGRKARQLHAAWEVVHRHLVALEMRELTGGTSTSDDAAMVLLAERLVEHLVAEIGDRP